ncbi:MAG: arylsulfatase [Acidobacteria bacterium]|nr:arylsulfatase [Acidobacteriota bacterium]
MNRRTFLFSSLTVAAQPRARRAPNVVVFLADDQGWGDLSIHGNTNLSTPNIDSLGNDGAIFDRFFVCAVCAPTRAEFLTGRYHARGGVRGVSTGLERLNTDEKTIAETFKASGYATGIFGKWHNGTQPPYHPIYRGFDEYYGMTSGHWGHYFDYDMDLNGQMVKGKGYIIDDLTNHAIDFIAKNRMKPFFCYVPFNSPHSPMQVPDKFYDKFAGVDPAMKATNPNLEDVSHTRAALAMCENIDWNVGRVLAKLKELRLDNDTLVLYFSDNGPNGWRWNGGMKGRKGTVDEGGIRSPLLVRFPGRIKPGTRIPQIAGAIDLLPTLADMTSVPVVSKKPLDGVSLRPLLEGTSKGWPDRMIFSLQNRRSSVRTQRFRLDPEGKLFDMVADPNQKSDVSARFADEAATLKKALDKWTAEMLVLTGKDDRPYPVGYDTVTWLPARDGVAHGGVKRSSGAPNDSYFTNWTAPADAITWDVEVLRPGTYAVDLYYTCGAGDVGSEIEVSVGSAKTTVKIATVNDPPLVGKKEDRHDRGQESFVKVFKPLRAGKLQLTQSRTPLTLRALSVKGKQVADIKYVVFLRE